MEKKRFLIKMSVKKRILVAVAALLLLFILWTVYENVTVGVTDYTVTDNRLPSSFDGYKIAVISDLHNAEFGEENCTIVEKVREAQPDIIAITGDLVDSNRTDIETAIQLVSQLTEIAPCYYVTGNHEARIGQQYTELEEKLQDENVTILHNEVVLLEKDGQTIQLAGVDDPDFAKDKGENSTGILQNSLQQMNLSDEYCILLSHRPELFETYVSEGMNLVLSGHAHGGQFRLPFIGGIVAPDQGFFPEYDSGVYTEGSTTMIVSRGIGNSIIPVRINNRPEIVIVELKSGE